MSFDDSSLVYNLRGKSNVCCLSFPFIYLFIIFDLLTVWGVHVSRPASSLTCIFKCFFLFLFNFQMCTFRPNPKKTSDGWMWSICSSYQYFGAWGIDLCKWGVKYLSCRFSMKVQFGSSAVQQFYVSSSLSSLVSYWINPSWRVEVKPT